MLASRYRSGVKRDGFTPTIREAGSSGTAATIWVVAHRVRTRARSRDGRLSGGTLRRLSGTASQEIRYADRASARLCCTGPTTAGRSEANGCEYRIRAQRIPRIGTLALAAECPRWVKSGKAQTEQIFSGLPTRTDIHRWCCLCRTEHGPVKRQGERIESRRPHPVHEVNPATIWSKREMMKPGPHIWEHSASVCVRSIQKRR
jgi:hypothetical protein